MVNQYCKNVIEGFEVSSEAAYEKYFNHPTWPGGESGVTIGIGFDLGYYTKTQVIAAWNSFMPLADMQKLFPVIGLKGNAAHAALASVKDIIVHYIAALQVFENVSLPSYEKKTLAIYPLAALLPSNVYGMLVSLIYNRGNGLIGDRRKEMKAIQPLVISKDIKGIADQFKSMQRLWPLTNGVCIRRGDEAEIVEACA